VTDLMAELQARDGLSFLFISHDLAVVERVSHRVAVMHAGRIVETGPTARVLAEPAHPYTRRLLAAVPVPDPARRDRARPALPPAPEPPALLLPFGQVPPRAALHEIAPGHFILEGTDRSPGPPASGPAEGLSGRRGVGLELEPAVSD
jgi:peptide/nickel transport system ATP-binding protein/glutathione transport system ATP-binding protein